MSTMLPVISDDQRWLADVLTSAFASVRGDTNRLGLDRARHGVVVLVDGLGAENLSNHRAHARSLTSLASRTVMANFPSTTASSLATLTTGGSPGQTGMLGYAIRNPRTGSLVNQLSGLDELDVAEWQPLKTVWESHSEVPSIVVSAERYRNSGLTRAILRGGEYVTANTYDDRLDAVAQFIRTTNSGVAYVYIPELDQAAHQFGVASGQWTRRLEDLDGFIAQLLGVLGARDGLLLTADHGVLDVPSVKHRIIPVESPLLDGVLTGGEPRCLHLYTERDAEALAAEWRAVEGSHAYIATRSEAIAAGWFGQVSEGHEQRIGDVLITPRGIGAYYDVRTATTQSMAMIGQHGGLSRTETHVPLIRAGLFS